MKVFGVLCLFIVTVAFAAAQFPPAPADGTCEPGKTYQQDCNTCVCGNDRKLGCTYKLCLTRPKRNAGAELPPVPADGSCEPGKAYRQDCNTCRCGNDGRIGACTYKLCPPKPKREAIPPKTDCPQSLCGGSAHVVKRSPNTPLPPLPADGTCQPGNSYQADCNVCRCLDNKQLACTEKACVSLKPKRSADPQSCSPGQTRQDGCNTCRCTNGVWSCTRKICPGRKRRSFPAQPPQCAVGDVKQQDCNTCRCTSGVWSCSKKACVTPYSRSRRDTAKCTEGDTKQNDCNSCRCTKGGVWSCTKMACFPRTRRDVAVTSDLKNTPCAPNDYFHLDCNTCYCNSAKTGYLCTDHICSPDNSTEISTTPAAESTTSMANLTAENATDNCLHSSVPVISSTTNLPLEKVTANSTEGQNSEDTEG